MSNIREVKLTEKEKEMGYTFMAQGISKDGVHVSIGVVDWRKMLKGGKKK